MTRNAVPIAGDDLRVGDVFLPKIGRRMQVERITLVIRPGYPMAPMLMAHGYTEFADGHTASDWLECYFGDGWVVVERCDRGEPAEQ